MAFTSNTFKVYPESYYTGYSEVLAQQAVDLGAMRGAVVMETRNLQGELEKAAFYESIGSATVSERDPTDMTAASWNDLTQGETIGIRVYRNTKEKKAVAAFRQIGQDPQIFSFVLGTQHAKAIALNYLNTGLSALVGAIQAAPDNVYDATEDSGNETFTASSIIKMLDKLGDSASRVVALVMPSKMAHTLQLDQVESSVSTIAGPTIYTGGVGTLGLPVLVTDSPALIDLDPAGDGSADPEYKVIALTEGALRLTEDADRDVLSRLDDSQANLAMQVTSEWSFSVAVAGSAWDAGNYPTQGDLADPANWLYSFSDKRDAAGVLGVFNSAL